MRFAFCAYATQLGPAFQFLCTKQDYFLSIPRSTRWVADLWPAGSAGPQQLVLPVRQRVPYAPVWGIKTCSWHSCGMKIPGKENLVN